ncbi:MAG: C-type lectin domain-containing protein [Lachnospiraceae bacterium]|nr:C-type lectin domain-containing protein [Lachnospiraceae bacterium]
MNIKKIIFVIFIYGCAAILCACGKNDSFHENASTEERREDGENTDDFVQDGGVQEQMDEEKSEIAVLPDDKEPSIEEQNADDDSQPADLEREEWKDAYLSYLDTFEGVDACTYSLIYIDEDDIPELVIDTGYAAGGCMILTFHDGTLDGWQSSRRNFSYIEKGNLICNSDGNMGHYYDNVYTIQDGKWSYVGGGTFGDNPEGIQLDENGYDIYVYQWNEEDVSGEEYEERLNQIYPCDLAVRPERYYIPGEITSLLRTGDVASAGHRYELLVENLTWKEAEALCREKGGYLAAVTSWEELERIQEQIISEGKTDIMFFVGASHEHGELGYRWNEPESGSVYSIFYWYNALHHFWLEEEPNYTGLTEDGVEIDQDYVVLFYQETNNRCYIKAVPDDFLSVAPSYSGRIGYICEYDS